VRSQSSGDFASLYKVHGLEGGHVIKLGPRNDAAAKEALAAWPGSVSSAHSIVPFTDPLMSTSVSIRRTSNRRRHQ
jgi:hypothetical protein